MSFLWRSCLFRDIKINEGTKHRIFQNNDILVDYIQKYGIDNKDDYQFKLYFYLHPYTMNSKQIHTFFKYFDNFNDINLSIIFHKILYPTQNDEIEMDSRKYFKRLYLIIKYLISDIHLRDLFLNYNLKYYTGKFYIFCTIKNHIKYDEIYPFKKETFVICRNELRRHESLSKIIFQKLQQSDINFKTKKFINGLIYKNQFYITIFLFISFFSISYIIFAIFVYWVNIIFFQF